MHFRNTDNAAFARPWACALTLGQTAEMEEIEIPDDLFDAMASTASRVVIRAFETHAVADSDYATAVGVLKQRVERDVAKFIARREKKAEKAGVFDETRKRARAGAATDV